MATYAIGDVQGCLEPLERLVARIDPGPDDRLWFAGDLVNRGPRSADALRWVRDLGDRAVAVLGNHDLHLLAVAAGRRALKARDTLEPVLDAPDLGALVDWLRTRPMTHRAGRHLMVHAGLLPTWRLAEAERLARSVEARLRGDAWADFLEALQRDDPADEAVEAAQVLSRVRICDERGRPDYGFAATLGEVPPGRTPWWRLSAAIERDEVTVVIGHWSALGYHREPGLLATDSGCVWGRCLTAVRLEDGAVFQEAADAQPTIGDV